ncbi:hypothetical protein FO519_001802 [Halicephalobus sp. NKZ332]|nr:hypothetical protein FO519_001802 [Halicephalobus sp. NKZ332]
MVGLVILPFSIANEALNRYWIFGDTWCTMWLTMDIWMCTASIYNLVAISIDRYIAIIKPLNYPMLVTKFRARCIVAAVWIGSFIICSPSFLLASTDTSKPKDCKCTPANSGIAYIIFSASSSFYIPMIIVIFVYVRIYIAACAATKSVYSGMMQVTANANKNPKNILMQNPSALSRSENMPMLRVHRGSSVAVKNPSLSTQVDTARSRTNVVPVSQNGGSPTVYAQMNGSSTKLDETACPLKRTPSNSKSETHLKSLDDATVIPNIGATMPNTYIGPKTTASQNNNHLNNNNYNNKILLHPNDVPSKKKSYGANMINKIMRRGPRKRAGCAYEKRLSLEIKAAKTVAIVTGCFIFCWLGFSILYGFNIETNEVVWSIVFWLGYLNSALNPVIYTVFNREFRTCFKRLLTCNHILFSSQSAQQTTVSS